MFHRSKTFIAAGLFALAPLTVQAADILNIVVGNLDLEFDGTTGQLSDAQLPNTAFSLDTADSFAVISVDVEVNSVIDTQLTSPPDSLFVDYFTTGLGSELALDAYNETSNLGALDLFSTTAGLTLQLDLTSLNYLVVDTAVPGADLFQFNAVADVVSQTIPNGRLYGPTVLVSYTATNAELTLGSEGVENLTASGQLTITGTLVPEPSSLALIGLGAAAMLRIRRNA